MPDHVIHSEAWFDECFDPDAPPDLRAFSTFLCRQHGIRGLCDPMYIANVTALEMGRGDGQGVFYAHAEPSMLDRQESFRDDARRLAERLCFSYSSTILPGRNEGERVRCVQEAVLEILVRPGTRKTLDFPVDPSRRSPSAGR